MPVTDSNTNAEDLSKRLEKLVAPPVPRQADLDEMWGYIETGQYGWKTCQFEREGRLDLPQVCGNPAAFGEKYCQKHMPRTPSRIFWFLLGVAVMWILTRLL